MESFESTASSGQASETKPKKRSAFEVLMANRAKKQKLKKSSYKYSSKNAFEEMMGSAREWGAFDPFFEKFSNQNSNTPNESYADRYDRPYGETDKFVKKQMERVEESRYEYSSDEDDGRCWSEDEEEDTDDDDDNESESSDCVGSVVKAQVSNLKANGMSPKEDKKLSSNGMVNVGENESEENADECKKTTSDDIVPEPRTQCSTGCMLREIRAHHSNIDKEIIMGFTFVYSDGTMLSRGNLRGTHESGVAKLEGDYICRIMVCYKTNGYIINQPKYLIGISFYTKQGNTITIDESDAWPQRRYEAGNELNIEKGYALKSLKWDEDSLHVVGVETEKIVTKSVDHTFFPSLTSLARKAIENDFRGRSAKHEKEAEKKVKRISEKTSKEIGEVYYMAEREVRLSAEAEKVRELRAQLALAEHNLSQKAGLVIRRAEEKSNKKRFDSKVSRLQIKNKLKRDRILTMLDMNNYRRALSENYELGSNDGGDRKGKTEICTSFKCLKFFDWTTVPAHKRCSIPGCTAKNPSCGCNIKACTRCHETICERHAKTHEKRCDEETCQRCGYLFQDNDDSVHPFTCGRILKACEEVECFYCKAHCCINCIDRCTGENSIGIQCGKPWCKQCQRPFSKIVRTCCDNCSFHRSLFD